MQALTDRVLLQLSVEELGGQIETRLPIQVIVSTVYFVQS